MGARGDGRPGVGIVVREAHAAYRLRPADAPRALTAVIDRSLRDLDAGTRLGRPPPHVPVAAAVPEMGRTRWPVPEAATPADLAALHEAAARGPASANRNGVPDLRAHLLGRIGWVEALNPARGARLRRSLAANDWSRE